MICLYHIFSWMKLLTTLFNGPENFHFCYKEGSHLLLLNWGWLKNNTWCFFTNSFIWTYTYYLEEEVQSMAALLNWSASIGLFKILASVFNCIILKLVFLSKKDLAYLLKEWQQRALLICVLSSLITLWYSLPRAGGVYPERPENIFEILWINKRRCDGEECLSCDSHSRCYSCN